MALNREFFMKLPEETRFYIFYNQQDEQQQMWAVESL
jgi:CCR4-NOT transcriptional regulation complex NOT5 subunit